MAGYIDEQMFREISDSRLFIPPKKYQLMPHPDSEKIRISCFSLDQGKGVKIRAWGNTLKEAYQQCGVAVLDYMTNLSNIAMQKVYVIDCSGENLVSLLESYLYELVRIYITKPYWLTKKVEFVEFLRNDYNLTCYCYGEYYKDYGNRHNDVPKVKNPRFSFMQVCDEPRNNRYEVLVTIDPTHPDDKFMPREFGPVI